jgi:5-methylcytosine-specific restriction enzyme A
VKRTIKLEKLKEGENYDRPYLARIWGYKASNAIARGVLTPKNDDKLILFITQKKQESLTQYNDYFDGDVLYIEGETNHANDKRIVEALTKKNKIYLFFREKHHSLFTYFGEVSLLKFFLEKEKPSRFSFRTKRSEVISETSLSTEMETHGRDQSSYPSNEEGKKVLKKHYSYERNRVNRSTAILIHGTQCKVCGFSFDKFYGSELARGYVEIHHVKPLSAGPVPVDPKNDLIPLCSNCHSMVHRRNGTIISVVELKKIIKVSNHD